MIKAYANSDHTYVVWRYQQPIPGCRGFALYRRRGGADELMGTWVGWAGDTAPAGTNKPSTQWPIQKFAWSDYDLHTGDTVQYRAVPMAGTKETLTAADAEATDWSEAVTLTAQAESGLEAYVNRGIVASQWVARSLGAPTSTEMGKTLAELIATPGDRTRDFLSGALRPALLQLLSDVATGGGTVYAALFELDDPELIPALTALGDRAHVVLANGTVKTPDGDENADARRALQRAGVTVHDRMVKSGHLDHHKYLVVCDAAGSTRSLWTGSTNWTKTGLCTQANNGILIRDATVAGWFKDHWDQLVTAGNGYPHQLIEADSAKRTTNIGDTTVTA